MQVKVNRRYTNNFQYGVAYTYSISRDYANDDSSDVNNGRPYKRFNYAASDFDQTHILTVNYIWDIPKLSRVWNNGFVKAIFDNWQISGTSSYATGKPKTVSPTFTSGNATISTGQPCPAGSVKTSATVCTMITDFTGGQVNARAFMICDPMKGVSGTDSSGMPYLINPGCFAVPNGIGDIGDSPRNNIRLPAIFNNDLAFFKNIPFGENRKIRLRWEIYNLFNRSNFRDMDVALTYGIAQVNPGGTGAACNTTTNICTAVVRQTRDTAFGSASSFGTATSARQARVMQASIQIDF
jgi:hypothetical protein